MSSDEPDQYLNSQQLRNGTDHKQTINIYSSYTYGWQTHTYMKCVCVYIFIWSKQKNKTNKQLEINITVCKHEKTILGCIGLIHEYAMLNIRVFLIF